MQVNNNIDPYWTHFSKYFLAHGLKTQIQDLYVIMVDRYFCVNYHSICMQ